MTSRKPQPVTPTSPRTLTIAGETVELLTIPTERPLMRWIDASDLTSLPLIKGLSSNAGDD